VERLARPLPRGGAILDVGNGLGKQDPVIARVARPARLVALNITESQLRAGRNALEEADARPVVADATRMPLRSGAVDGVISVEAAFHFSSRAEFFHEAHRALRPGGVLTMSDVSAEREPRGVQELVAGITLLRFWGLRRSSAMSARDIERSARAAGFTDVEVTRVGEQVFDPAIAFLREQLDCTRSAPRLQRKLARLMLDQWALLRRQGIMDYVLLVARA
jgi:erythromycin 3''-O-methyltransferase